MTSLVGHLASIADPLLRDDVDRVCAAAGISVVHTAEPSSRKAWSGAAAVVLDTVAAQRCAARGLPRRPRVLLVTRTEPDTAAWQTAVAVGAQRVLTLPDQDDVLMADLAEAGDSGGSGRGAVAAVIGSRGGAGATVFAAALARAAGDALLIDADAFGGGIDLVMGSEADTGLRWPDLRLRSGRVNYPALSEALPRVDGISVLSAGRAGTDSEVPAEPLGAVIDAGSRGGVTVVCDVPRRPGDAAETALAAADLVALVTPADVRSCAAGGVVAKWVSTVNPNAGIVVRGPAPGGLGSRQVADIVGLPLLAAMRPQPGMAQTLERGGLRIGRRSPLSAAARRVLTVLQHHPAVGAR
ncbi:septum site-determining protein Ssd [Mycolicibacterium phlei]